MLYYVIYIESLSNLKTRTKSMKASWLVKEKICNKNSRRLNKLIQTHQKSYNSQM